MSWTTHHFPRLGLPACAGVYVVYIGGRPVYVGQSKNIANRFYDHNLRFGYGRNIHTPWCEVPDSTEVLVKVKKSRRLGDWAMWEIRLIAKLNPIYNSQYRKRAKDAA